MDEELYIYRRALQYEQAMTERSKAMAEQWWGRCWKTSVILDWEEIAVKTATELKIKE